MTTSPITESHYITARAIAPTLDRDSARDGGLRAWLANDWQGGACADCGETGHALEFAHFHRSGGVYAAGLGAMTCRRCNLVHTHVADTDGSLPWAYVAGMAILPPAALPTRAALVRVHAATRKADHAGIVAEAAKRMAARGV